MTICTSNKFDKILSNKTFSYESLVQTSQSILVINIHIYRQLNFIRGSCEKCVYGWKRQTKQRAKCHHYCLFSSTSFHIRSHLHNSTFSIFNIFLVCGRRCCANCQQSSSRPFHHVHILPYPLSPTAGLPPSKSIGSPCRMSPPCYRFPHRP